VENGADPVERADLGAQRREHANARQPGGVARLFRRDFAADLAGHDAGPVELRRAVTGDEDEIAVTLGEQVVGRGGRLRQLDSQFQQPLLGRRHSA
jgi:hypothetical protein